MSHIDEPEVSSWLVVFAPLIGVVILTGLGYLMGIIAGRWRGKS